MRPGDKPWGNNKGPFWEMFVPDMIGVKLEAPPVPGGGVQNFGVVPALGDIEPLDLVATRANPKDPKKVTMNNTFTFTFKFKAHIKDDFKDAPAVPPASAPAPKP
jgi:hypothetical protein